MFQRFLCRAAPWACAGLLAVPAARATDAPEGVHALRQPLANYQRWRDEPVADWRRANDRVGEIGGWRTYLREAAPPAADADDGHAAHGPHRH
jgi:hypothetical protein